MPRDSHHNRSKTPTARPLAAPVLSGRRDATPLFLVDRDGVLVENRPTNIKTADDLELIPGAAEAIARLNRAGYTVAICTNQPEVARGAMTAEQLAEVHAGLERMLAERGAHVAAILCCTSLRRCPMRKPSPGMLREALRRFSARAAETAFVGDQLDDLKAAFRAGCRPVLVRTGLGRKVTERPLPQYLHSVAVFDSLADAVDSELQRVRIADRAS